MNAAARADSFDILIVGGGAAGVGVAASLLRRQTDLKIAIVEPSDKHYYQPAWTLVGGGAYDIQKTVRPTASVIPQGATWIRARVAGFAPHSDCVQLDDGRELGYRQLIVCPGLELRWDQVDGLEATLGKHGVTSNYRFDLAPYTWQLVRSTPAGRALFTQPPMPIKCAGAPQKALYLACDHWRRKGLLERIDVEFNVAGPVLFGVAAFVPSLMKYIERYDTKLALNSNLVAVDGPNRIASFDVKDADGKVSRVDKPFHMLHVVPPQTAPGFIRASALANAGGWCEVDPATLQHPRYPNVFGLGDVTSTPNAKTAAAVRKQIVVVAHNILAVRNGQRMPARYDGYGACPLTVENGKVVLAEFGYDGKLLPTFPLDPTVPRRLAWQMKTVLMPWLYWNGMLKGREWLTRTNAI
ncbi:NAD(P)/FAD-dependent oxidoreductase [Trinickia violacea]|uniref:NAD(P)/FAD-dependent oxidoreductase n=1 Tax=Trinickia violacea TaxID=2571746 RepID=A0A4P8J0K5_9BURK|nr:FAD/NAD(P)-binding oxidoreductase [Trinickia violacea]QCP53423.1 NAD(P)/FAD-dependent oxidoreductase [Trinickia violacea]